MKISNVMFKAAAALAVVSMMTACGGTNTAAPAAAPNAVGGAAVKGPFKTGASVVACPVNPATAGCAGATTATTTVSDNLGTYNLPNIPWGGLTLITISGNYLDEISGGTQVGTLSALIDLPAPAVGGNVIPKVYPNVATSIAASMAATNAANGIPLDTTSLQAANDLAVSALGLPAGTDPTTLNPLSGTTPADQAFLTISAAFSNLASTGISIEALATSMATDIGSGLPLGSTIPTGAVAPVTAALNNSVTTATASAATITANLQAAAPAGSTVVITTPVAPPPMATVLRGLALAGNSFMIGQTQCGVAATGVATCVGNPAVNNVVFNFPLLDLTDINGTAAGAAGTTTMAVSFSLADTAVTVGTSMRRISGTISPVNVTTNGAGGVTLTVPANATMTFSGTTSTGGAVSGTVTNVAANTFTSLNNMLSMDANAILAMVQTKVGNASLMSLTLPGTYNFTFGVTGNIGFVNGNTISNLIPVGVGGARVISGTITTI